MKKNNQEFGDALEALVVKENKKVKSVLFSHFPSCSIVKVFYKVTESFGVPDKLYVPTGKCINPESCFNYLQIENLLR